MDLRDGFIDGLVSEDNELNAKSILLYHVAKRNGYTELFMDVHLYLAGLASNKFRTNPCYVVNSPKELTAALKKHSISGRSHFDMYWVGKHSGDFHLNYGAMIRGGYTVTTDSVGRALEAKQDIGFLRYCYYVACELAGRVQKSSELSVYRALSVNPEFYFELLSDYYGFMSKSKDFSPSENEVQEFNRAYRQHALSRMRARQIENDGVSDIPTQPRTIFN